MPQFTYRARNAQGGLVEGVLDCADRAIAIHQIESQHCIPIRIDMVEAAKPTEAKASKPHALQRKLRLLSSPEAATPSQSLKIPHGQLLIFTEQLAHLLTGRHDAGRRIVGLGETVKTSARPQMTHTLHQALIDGRSFSQALSDMPRIFPPLYVNLVAAGEASGALPQILLTLGETSDAGQELARPGATGVDLSGISRAGRRYSCHNFHHLHGAAVDWVHGANRRRHAVADADLAARPPCDHRLLVGRLLIVVGGIIGFRAMVRTQEGRIGWDRFRLLIPGYGRVIRHRYYAQFARTLGTLMENGVPLLRALDLVTEIAGNRFLEAKLGEVRRAVIDGATLSAALQQQKLFPDLFTDMMAVGEQTGHFAETMQAIADVYERELDRSVGVISQLIPPVIIVIIAGLVGLVVFSILSAVFEMTHSLQVRPR